MPPIYVYACSECGAKKEVMHKITESPVIDCDQCRSVMYRQISGGIGTIYKGKGWFKTDGKY